MFRVLVHNRRIFHSCIILLLFTLTAAFWTHNNVLGIPGTENGGSKSQDAILLGRSESTEHFYDPTNLDTLTLAQAIFRHGARTPLYLFPTDPNKNHDYGVGSGNGQLLTKGKKQAYELGKYLRKRYDGFLGQLYSQDQIYTQSSDVDRTIMTAEMVLAGIFPTTARLEDDTISLQWKPIPVHSLTKWIDNKIGFDYQCDRRKNLKKDYLSSPTMKEFDAENEWLYKFCTEKTNLSITCFKDVQRLMDTFNVEVENGLVLPDWSNKIYPEKMSGSFNLQFVIESITPPQRRLIISPLVTEIIRNMDLRIYGNLTTVPGTLNTDLSDYHNRSAKVYLYSGHDTTLSPFLNSFDVYDGQQPTYVSAIIIELHQSTKNSGQVHDNYIVKVFYKKKTKEPIRELDLPNCRNPCTLSNFKANYNKYLMNHREWVEECSK